jgi:homoserine kinase
VSHVDRRATALPVGAQAVEPVPAARGDPRHGSATPRATFALPPGALMHVRVPASSANLGPGFDALGLALDLPCDVADDPAPLLAPGPGGAPGVDPDRPADPGHPAAVAHRIAGGTGPLWVRTAIPPARGLGFSGAARVGGALLAARRGGDDPVAARARAFEIAAALEGHPDNAAASAHGGCVVAAGGHVVDVPWRVPGTVTVWVPDVRTGTDESRGLLPATVPFADAAHAVGRAALLVAALAGGALDVLRAATEDRLHQDVRLARLPSSRAALDAFLAAGAWAAWLSGSGPTVAALVPGGATPGGAVPGLPADGVVLHLAVDHEGARVV